MGIQNLTSAALIEAKTEADTEKLPGLIFESLIVQLNHLTDLQPKYWSRIILVQKNSSDFKTFFSAPSPRRSKCLFFRK